MQVTHPGVFIIEQDFSEYVASIASTAVGMVGTAQLGPINVPTLITSPDEFVSTFGKPSVNSYGPYAALNYLRQGNQLWYVRVAKLYTKNVGVFHSYSYNSITNTYTVTLTSAANGIAVGNWIRISQDGLPTSNGLRVTNVNGAILTIDPTTNANFILPQNYTDGVANVDVDASVTGGAANSAEVFAPSRYNGVISQMVKFTAANAGAWANYGSGGGIEVTITDGGALQNINPSTGQTYEWPDGTSLAGILPSSPSVDSALDLFALTSSDVSSGVMKGVNRDFLNTAVLNITNDGSGNAQFHVENASLFTAADKAAVNGSLINNAASSYDAYSNIYVASVNSGTNVVELAHLTDPKTILNTVNDSGTTQLVVNNTSGVSNSDIVVVSGTGKYDGVYTVTSTGVGTIDISLTYDSGFAGATGTVVHGRKVQYLNTSSPTTDVYGNLLDLSKAAPAGVYLCTGVTSSGSTWNKIGIHTKQLRVFVNGIQQEVFDGLIGYDNTSANYWDNKVGTENSPVSKYIFAEYLGTGNTAGAQPMSTYNNTKFPNNPRLLMGNSTQVRAYNVSSSATTTFANCRGVDGANPNASAYIGAVQSDRTSTGLQCFYNVSQYPINLVCVPGITLTSVIDAVITLCETRKDCLGILDTPLGLSVQEAIDWHNGQGIYAGDHSAFVTNKAAMYYPWVLQYDPYSSSNIWLPPSAVVPAVISYSDSVGELWYAPAGINRGTIPNAISVETQISEGDMDAMYGPGNGNALNPIVQFPQNGIVVWGQRTLQRTPSSLDRINVRRLVFYIEKSLSAASRQLNFEQNDPILWAQILNLYNPFLLNLKGRRALYWFQTVCDSTTNTAQTINQNQVVSKVYLIAEKSAEAIVIQVALLPNGANVSEFVTSAQNVLNNAV